MGAPSDRRLAANAGARDLPRLRDRCVRDLWSDARPGLDDR
jgi:hypothetical protein